MLEFTTKIESSTTILRLSPTTTLTLPLYLRRKSRQRVVLDNGKEAALLLKRGTVLFHGDLLLTEEGIAIQVQAAKEQLSRVHCSDVLLFARACYHLGNRHMPLQMEKETLFYLHDHVLDDMLRGLGLVVSHLFAAFEPEPGAYAGQVGHHHAH